ncbi:MAG: type V CRISPR-associated endonuclease Cas1 [Bacteroidales bacterium]
MFTRKDIERKNIFVINGLENHHFRINGGFLWLDKVDGTSKKCIAKFPVQKVLFLLVIGHTTVTTAVLDRCNKAKVPVVVMKPNFRCVFNFCNIADANYLLRKRQHSQPALSIDLAQGIIRNKMQNQLKLLKKTRKKDSKTNAATVFIAEVIQRIKEYDTLSTLMGVEGMASRLFFDSLFQNYSWQARRPRIKCDPLNALLDIGYTFLFNYIESMCRLFGFDLYIGIYHQLFFKRKSLVCDLVEPFRCVIEHAIRKNINLGKIQFSDFEEVNKAFYIKYGKRSVYTNIFMEALIKHKNEIFIYIQQYYRFFMNRQSVPDFPVFILK